MAVQGEALILGALLPDATEASLALASSLTQKMKRAGLEFADVGPMRASS